MDKPAGALYACLACGAGRTVPETHYGAVWCPCGSPEPMQSAQETLPPGWDPAAFEAELAGRLPGFPHGSWRVTPSGEPQWVPLNPPVAGQPLVTLESVQGLISAYERACETLAAGAQAYWDALSRALAPVAAAVALPWDDPGADILGDIRRFMEAASSVPAPSPGPAVWSLLGLGPAREVTILHTDSAARISSTPRPAPSEAWEVLGDAMQWSPGDAEL